MATYDFPGRALAHLWMSYEIPAAAAMERARYTFVGTEAVVDVNAYGGVDVVRGDTSEPAYRDERFVGPGTTWDWQAPYFRRAFRDQAADLAEAIRDGRPVAIDGVEGRKAVDMALQRPGGRGRRIPPFGWAEPLRTDDPDRERRRRQPVRSTATRNESGTALWSQPAVRPSENRPTTARSGMSMSTSSRRAGQPIVPLVESQNTAWVARSTGGSPPIRSVSHASASAVGSVIGTLKRVLAPHAGARGAASRRRSSVGSTTPRPG